MKHSCLLYIAMLALVGCAEGVSDDDKGDDGPLRTVLDTDTDTDTDPDTDDTDTDTEPPFDCTTVPDQPLSSSQMDIETTEDFDFDAEGQMVFANWLGSTLFGVDIDRNFSVIATGIYDTRGISVLADGRIIIAYIGNGTIAIMDPVTGSNTVLLSNLSQPNALEVGDNDLVYFSEIGANQRVMELNISTLETKPVAGGFTYPNGLVLNANHDILYVSDFQAGIYAVPKNADGTWGDKYLVHNPPGDSYDGMAVDVCDNLYVLSFNGGKIVRMDMNQPAPYDPVVVAELTDPQAFLWNALHWGSDRGGWNRDTLYVTDRNKIFALEMGVPGKRQPIDDLP